MKTNIKSTQALFALAVFFPLSLLFFKPGAGFSSDWYNNLWMIAYQAKYFLKHLQMSPVLNTEEWVGISFPIFYGFLFYPLSGLLSIFVGPHLAIRLWAVILLSAQFIIVKRLFFKLSQDSTKSAIIAVLVTWAIYPLTNLYNRSALPEFFSTLCLTCAFCLWFLILLEKERSKQYQLALGMALISALMAGIHAITAFYGLQALGLTLVVTAFFHCKDHPGQLKTVCGIVSLYAVLVILALLPWFYAVISLRHSLGINGALSRLIFFDGIDILWIRLFPLPLDYRTLKGGISPPTPGLDAQINFGLLVFTLGSVLALRKALWKDFLRTRQGITFLVCFLSFIWILIVSISPHGYGVLGRIFHRAQFAYRFVTYANLALFLSTVALYWPARFKINSFNPLFSAVMLTIAGCSVLMKLLYASLIWPEGKRHGYPHFDRNCGLLAHVPNTFYGLYDYTTSHLEKAENLSPSFRVNLPVHQEDQFGQASEANFVLDKTSWVIVNIYPFPWNRIEVDGGLIPNEEVKISETKLAVRLAAGPHSVRYRFVPDPVWAVLYQISFFSLAFLFILTILFTPITLGYRRRDPAYALAR